MDSLASSPGEPTDSVGKCLSLLRIVWSTDLEYLWPDVSFVGIERSVGDANELKVGRRSDEEVALCEKASVLWRASEVSDKKRSAPPRGGKVGAGCWVGAAVVVVVVVLLE